jgi:thiosulfate/3-mercaptopyruvate sulfurtransferase
MRPTRYAAFALVAIAATATAQSARPTRADLTVTPAWLAEHLKDPDLVLFHVGEKAEYEKGHIPGARFVQMSDVALSSMDHEKGLMLELPTADSLRARLEKLGISDNSRIVVYYGNDWVSPSTRIIFTLDAAGLGNRSALLDGGMVAWKTAGNPLSTEAPKAVAGKLSALKVKPLVVDAAFVQSHVKSPGFKVVDARSGVFYDGIKVSDTQRKGHVAGAKSLPFDSVFDDANRLKPVGELTVLFQNAGIAPGDTIVGYCHIGQQATAMLFAARTLGHPVLLYDGSFQDYSRRTELPVEAP